MVTLKPLPLVFFVLSISIFFGKETVSENKLEKTTRGDVIDKEEMELGKMIINSNEYAKIEEKIKNIESNLERVNYSNEDINQIIEVMSEEDIVNEEYSINMEGNAAQLEDHINRDEKRIEGHVVGGNFAKITDYPHAVYVLVCYGESCWSCGASVVNQRILMTAAHCLPPDSKEKTEIHCYAGSADYEKAEVITVVKKYIKHFDYVSEGDTSGDIGLFFTGANLPLGQTIKRVIMRLSFPQNVAELSGFLAGWGAIDVLGHTSSRMKVVQQKVWARSDCSKYSYLEPGNLCACGGNNDYPSRGDSGSALININKQQLGILSYTHKKHPEILTYTNVSYHYHWIEKMSEKLYCYR